ncbi:hypothetical protein WN48_07335 [Eufriesea mexicana]|nr:hypothetical protein WN48_07335 [Eufriesea mexicana]
MENREAAGGFYSRERRKEDINAGLERRKLWLVVSQAGARAGCSLHAAGAPRRSVLCGGITGSEHEERSEPGRAESGGASDRGKWGTDGWHLDRRSPGTQRHRIGGEIGARPGLLAGPGTGVYRWAGTGGLWQRGENRFPSGYGVQRVKEDLDNRAARFLLVCAVGALRHRLARSCGYRPTAKVFAVPTVAGNTDASCDPSNPDTSDPVTSNLRSWSGSRAAIFKIPEEKCIHEDGAFSSILGFETPRETSPRFRNIFNAKAGGPLVPDLRYLLSSAKENGRAEFSSRVTCYMDHGPGIQGFEAPRETSPGFRDIFNAKAGGPLVPALRYFSPPRKKMVVQSFPLVSRVTWIMVQEMLRLEWPAYDEGSFRQRGSKMPGGTWRVGHCRDTAGQRAGETWTGKRGKVLPEKRDHRPDTDPPDRWRWRSPR